MSERQDRDGPGARILVTEGQPEVVRAVAGSLGKRYRCALATDLHDAREQLARGAFELALCGTKMPGAPGLALAEEIAREHPDTAIVLIAAEDDPEVAQRAFAAGVSGYLVEPFWPGQLLITVMSALRRRDLELAGRAHSANLARQRQTIIDMAPMPIYVKDSSYRYVLANVQADVLAGLEQGQLVGVDDEAIMDPVACAHTRALDRAVLEHAAVHDIEELLTIGGVERVFRTTKFPLLGEDGEVVAVCGISADVTDHHEALRLRDELAASQRHAIDELWASQRETVDCFARAIKRHDSSTGDHVTRMAGISALLGDRLQLGTARVQLLRIAAPMHDVGKIGVPDRILRKPGPLTSGERRQMQCHTTIGHEILRNSRSELLGVAATIALTHHERFDGSGYPSGIVGYDIPLEGRIAALGDVFDALLSERCYRPAFAVDEAVAMVVAGRASQFDPLVVDTLVDNLDEALGARR